jgi:hypothetical protein
MNRMRLSSKSAPPLQSPASFGLVRYPLVESWTLELNEISTMPAGAADDLIAESIAKVLVDGFNKHYRLFHESSALAKRRFEEARWQEVQQAVRDRIQFYDDRVRETTERLHREFMRTV